MINQIDEDLLQEAAEERDAGNVQTWRRVVPVAVCVVALITAASISILTRGIRIENGKEHHGTSILTEEELSETTVVTEGLCLFF
jgi:hypothetical protein